jgi:hypothetical protein
MLPLNLTSFFFELGFPNPISLAKRGHQTCQSA